VPPFAEQELRASARTNLRFGPAVHQPSLVPTVHDLVHETTCGVAECLAVAEGHATQGLPGTPQVRIQQGQIIDSTWSRPA
jgi:hypothetical protein